MLSHVLVIFSLAKGNKIEILCTKINQSHAGLVSNMADVVECLKLFQILPLILALKWPNFANKIQKFVVVVFFFDLGMGPPVPCMIF